MSQPARTLAWQGWTLALPRRWDPVQLSGTAAAGHALVADVERPQLGLRWQTPRPKRLDVAAAVRATLVAEVGRLAADEAVPCPLAGDWESPLLYVEPAPPGRDVWVGFDAGSGRLLTVARPVGRRRERVLANVVLPTLSAAPLDRASLWSVFDLAVTVPADFALSAKQLNAGDLSLTFADRRGVTLTVRQIAVADLALRRRTLDGWIADQRKPLARVYRPDGPPVDVGVDVGGRRLDARAAHVRRRRRFALAAWHPRGWSTVAAHDVARDRLVILQGTDDGLLRVVADSVGLTAVAACPA